MLVAYFEALSYNLTAVTEVKHDINEIVNLISLS